MQLPRDEPKDSEEYATRGPFTNIFDGAIARLLDQAIIVGNMEQTITILAESINQSYKTTKAHLRNWKNGVCRADKKNRKRPSIQVPLRKPPKRITIM